MQRIVFVNLHGNAFLVKTLNKFIFKKSAAIKHKYWLDYLLQRDDIEVCSYINKKGFSLTAASADRFSALRFLESNIAFKKNGIDPQKITIIKSEKEIRKEDILIVYNIFRNDYLFEKRPDCFIAVSMIHFETRQVDLMRNLSPDVLFNECTFQHDSKIFNRYYSWFHNDFVCIPFVYEERFTPKQEFAMRKNKCVSVGTITYMKHIVEVYGDPCAQPARKMIKDHQIELEPLVDCYNSDYLEDNAGKVITSNDNSLTKLYKRIYNKLNTGKQKKYYSFNMVDKFNEYKMCFVGEEIMGIPGVGFVEGMACGCAYIGQNCGFYEDYGMKEGVHYIGYDGTLEDLKRKILYYQQPENQDELERIARAGCDYVRQNFRGPVIAEKLTSRLLELNSVRLATL